MPRKKYDLEFSSDPRTDGKQNSSSGLLFHTKTKGLTIFLMFLQGKKKIEFYKKNMTSEIKTNKPNFIFFRKTSCVNP